MSGIEEWRPIPGHPKYEVSSLGRVRSLYRKSPHVLKPWLAGGATKYPTISFAPYGRRTVHRLVALAFFGEPPARSVVMHLDGNPLNNRVENLVYGTQALNIQHAVATKAHWQSRKTECLRGHEFNEENTRFSQRRDGSPFRDCRACQRSRWAEKKAS